ncbi:MAG: cysteine desulfurase [bacterium]|nr:cysteine desulfurase [bacterium]
MGPVYFDHNATTPLEARVRDAMLPWMSGGHGNPSSVHSFGRRAREAVDAARETLARSLGGLPPEYVFTASGTEANNAVVLGLAHMAADRAKGLPEGSGRHLVISALEHPSILRAAERLESSGVRVTRVPPSSSGVVDSAELTGALDDDSFLVCLMLANNEVGTIQCVQEVALACRERGVPVLCDAVQAVGKISVSIEELGVDYLTLGAHKFYGPAGAAALWMRGGASFESYLIGGSQERRRRAGTENVPAIVGLGVALELAVAELEERRAVTAALRDRFEAGLDAIGDVVIHAVESPRLPNTSNVALLGVSADSLMIRLDLQGFAVSAGSACSAGRPEPPATLLSMGIEPAEALCSLRVSCGPTNTTEEVDRFLEVLAREVAALRELAAPAASLG